MKFEFSKKADWAFPAGDPQLVYAEVNFASGQALPISGHGDGSGTLRTVNHLLINAVLVLESFRDVWFPRDSGWSWFYFISHNIGPS